MKSRWIKTVNDFILGCIMLAVSLFLLLFHGITTAIPGGNQGGFFTRPDVYIRMLAAILGIVSLLLILRSSNWKRAQTGGKLKFVVNSTVVITVAALLLYTLLLPVLGFWVCTSVMVLGLNLLYTYKENNKSLKQYDRSELVKALLIGVVYTVFMDAVLWLVFAKLLNVRFP